MAIVRLDDLFDFSGSDDLQKLTKRLRALDKVFQSLEDNVKSLESSYSQSLKSIDESTEKYNKSLNSLSSASKKEIEEVFKLEKALEKLSAEQDKLIASNKKLEAELAKLRKQRKETNELEKEGQRLARQKARLDAKQALSTSQLAKDVNTLNEEIKANNREQRQNAKLTASTTTEYEKLAIRAVKAKREFKDLAAQFGATSKQAENARIRASKLDQELKEIDKSVGDNQREVGNYRLAVQGLAGSFENLLSSLSPASSSITQASGGLQGLSFSAGPAALALGAIAAAGLGIAEVATTVKEVNDQLLQTSKISGLTGDELGELTGNIRTTAKAFNQEFGEVLKAQNAIVKEFGISGKEATDLINAGFIQGADINNDFLDQLREYAPQIKQAGLEADNLVQVIALGAKEGIFNDKAIDAVKEGGLRLREFTKATSDALQPLGDLRNAQIKQAIESGKSFEAIQLVSKGLSEVSLSAKETQTIITDVFGGPGEDAGLRFIQLLGDIDTNQGAVLSNLTKQQKLQLDILKVEQQISEAEVELAQNFTETGNSLTLLGKNLQLGLIKGFNRLIDLLRPIGTTFGELFDQIGRFVTQIREAAGASEDAGGSLNLLEIAIKAILFPFQFLTKILTVVIRETTNFISTNELAQASVKALTVVFRAFGDYLQTIPKIWTGLGKATLAFFRDFKKVAFETLKDVGSFFVSAFTLDIQGIKTAIANGVGEVKGFGTDIKKAFLEGYNSLSIEDEVKKDTEAVKKATEGATKEIEKTASKQKAVNDEYRTREQLLQDLAKAQETLNNEIAKELSIQSPEKIEELKRTIEEINKLLGLDEADVDEKDDPVKEVFRTRIKLTKDLEKAQADLNAELEKAEILQSPEKIAQLSSEIENLNGLLGKEKEISEDQKGLIEGINKGIGTRIDLETQLLREQAGQAENARERQAINEEIARKEAAAQEQKAFVTAFANSIADGDSAGEALSKSLSALAGLRVGKAVISGIQGLHTGGYTGDGSTYEYHDAPVHKGEYVMNKDTTTKLGLRHKQPWEVDKTLEAHYFNRFKMSMDDHNKNDLSPSVNVTVDNKIDYDELGKNVAKYMPRTDMSIVGNMFRLMETQGSKTINKIFTRNSDAL